MLQSNQVLSEEQVQSTKSSNAFLLVEKGIPVGGYLLLAMAIGFFVVGGTFAFLAFRYIPDIR